MFMKLVQSDCNKLYVTAETVAVIAGVGNIGKDAVCQYKISGLNSQFVESLVMFTYDNQDIDTYRTLYEESCKKCMWLFIIADLKDDKTMEQICEVAHFESNAEKRFCITLEKYRGSKYITHLQTYFDHIIYVEQPEAFFGPLETLFLHPVGYMGIDYIDYRYALAQSNELFFAEATIDEPSKAADSLYQLIQNKSSKFCIEQMKLVIQIFCPPCEDFKNLHMITDQIEKIDVGDDNLLWNVSFHRENSTALKCGMLICAVKDKE